MRDREGDAPPGWAYVSIVDAIPGISIRPWQALVIQFVTFEGAAIGLALIYGLFNALPIATVAIGVATAGSFLMTRLHDRIRALQPPESYGQFLLDGSIDVVMGLVAFIALVTYLLVTAQAGSEGVLEQILGSAMPAPAVFLALVIAWDLCYRIGTGWLASVTGLWRSIAYRESIHPDRQRLFARTDALVIVFASLQLLLLPFIWPERLLALLVLGHVCAVVLVSGLALGLQYSA